MKAGCLPTPWRGMNTSYCDGGWQALPGPVFLIKKVTQGVTPFHPKKPRVDFSIIPGEEGEDTYSPYLPFCCSDVPKGPGMKSHLEECFPAFSISQNHRGEARRRGVIYSSGYFRKPPD